MSLFSGTAAITKNVEIAGSALSLVSLGKAFIKPKKDIAPGINGFVFDITETDDLTLAANITDHYIEDNTTIQDHIAIAPVTYTLTGLVGELFIEKTKAEEFATAVLDRLQPLGVISPGLSASAQKALIAAEQVKQAADQAVETFNSLKAAIEGTQAQAQSRQQAAFDILEKMFSGRTLSTVVTPWKNLDNMAIESINFNQDATSRDFSRVTITMKQLRFVSTEINAGVLKGRIKQQKAGEVDQGKRNDKSLSANIFDGVVDRFK